MAFLNSNEPYQRVDDGIGNGLIAGGIIGAAAYGGAYVGLPRMKQTEPVLSMKNNAGSINIDPSLLKKMTDEQKAKMGIDDSFKESTRPSQAARLHKTIFGSGIKRAAIAGGVSVLGGAILGGTIDAMR